MQHLILIVGNCAHARKFNTDVICTVVGIPLRMVHSKMLLFMKHIYFYLFFYLFNYFYQYSM